MVLVLPPELEARIAIWIMHLRDRPVAGIDVKKLARPPTDDQPGDIEGRAERGPQR